jgi:heavy metal translocating P-type ATPase
MLMEAHDHRDPSSFRESELFKKCREIGIIPRSETDLTNSATQPTTVVSLQAWDNVQEQNGAPNGISRPGTLNLSLLVQDMWCPACAWVIEETLKRMPGVAEAACNFSTDRIRCTFDPFVASPSVISEAIENLGYRVSSPGEDRVSDHRRREFIRFAVSAFLTMNVMMLSFALYSGFFTELSADAIRKLSWPIFAMATIVLSYGGRRVYQRVWAGAASPGSGMESLIAAGSLSAYGYSTFNLLSGNIHLYYDTASMLITLFLLGKTLERRAKDRIQEDLGDFFSLEPAKVRICTDLFPDGRYVSARQLEPEDIFRSDENEVVPADGVIVAGEGSVDESSLTGEALPVSRKPGQRLRSGVRVVQGTFNVRAEKVGKESTLGQMLEIMEKALGTRTRLEGKTDRYLRWFVPGILLLAAGTGAFCLLQGLSTEHAVLRAVTVMVISCPCALGLAIPLARVAGISLARKAGILSRDFSAFEKSLHVDTFVFDKTGTMTTGLWSLLEVHPFEPLTRAQALSLAASLEKESEHHIAEEIRRRAQEQGIPNIDVRKIRTFENGLSGKTGHSHVRIGSGAFLSKELDQSDSPFLPDLYAKHTARSLVFMGLDGRLCAVFVFGDQVKKGAAETVRLLENQGHRTLLVSGDGEEATKAIGQKIGIASSHGRMLPLDKVDLVKKLQREGHGVAMVGDGINDAPALAQADLAVAVYSGSHLADEAADITLMRGDPRQLLDFLGLAKTVNGKIQQNLLCSFLYNLISIPLAMSGLLTPLVAVSAMLLSSLSVIGNTILLIKRERTHVNPSG